MEVPSPPLHSVCFESDNVIIHTIGLCWKGNRGQQPTGPEALKVFMLHLTQGSCQRLHSQPDSSLRLVLRVYSHHESPDWGHRGPGKCISPPVLTQLGSSEDIWGHPHL